jgi:hypothetical protein
VVAAVCLALVLQPLILKLPQAIWVVALVVQQV